jgi:hypothetical protein
MLAALALSAHAARLQYAQWAEDHPANGREPAAPHVTGSFADCVLPEPSLREVVPGLAVAFCLQAGLAAVALRYPLLGASCLCMGTALLTVFRVAAGAAEAGRVPALPQALLGVLATMALAVILTAAGTPGRSIGTSKGFGERFGSQRPGLVASARALLSQLFYGRPEPKASGTAAKKAAPDDAGEDTGVPGGFPGVVLWPEIKSYTTLIAPPPPPGHGLFYGPAPQPLGIPFYGEYWLFRWPFDRPPPRSMLRRGTPTAMSFSTTDRERLHMEAHQKLESSIAVDCCSEIDLEIANADRFPGTVLLALAVIDSSKTRPSSLSLGVEPVESRPDLAREPVLPVRETLHFAMRAASWLGQFDEFRVTFYRDSSRADKSARIAIQRFVLVPR